MVKIRSTSSSVFELCKELTVDCTEEPFNISTSSGVLVKSYSDDFESIVHKGPGIRKLISSKTKGSTLFYVVQVNQS
jgi:hypothetical protein